MFIDNKQYQTNLVDVNNIRYLLHVHFYNNPGYIESLKDVISRSIDCIKIEYSESEYKFTIKVKKTSLKKMRGAERDSSYYYGIISGIFRDFLESIKKELVQVLKTKYQDPYNVLNSIYDNESIMANLCNISRISDNIIIVGL